MSKIIDGKISKFRDKSRLELKEEFNVVIQKYNQVKQRLDKLMFVDRAKNSTYVETDNIWFNNQESIKESCDQDQLENRLLKEIQFGNQIKTSYENVILLFNNNLEVINKARNMLTNIKIVKKELEERVVELNYQILNNQKFKEQIESLKSFQDLKFDEIDQNDVQLKQQLIKIKEENDKYQELVDQVDDIKRIDLQQSEQVKDLIKERNLIKKGNLVLTESINNVQKEIQDKDQQIKELEQLLQDLEFRQNDLENIFNQDKNEDIDQQLDDYIDIDQQLLEQQTKMVEEMIINEQNEE